jgi:environmental stress-induced protein Ves
MRILRAADHKRMPWKNGGGETTEIAVFPEGAGLDDFDWRVSMARVDGDGPFSSFPSIDRTLAILEGAGIVLYVEGRAATLLTHESDPLAFPADVATSARLIDGSVIDFNVMSRRGIIQHAVTRLAKDHVSPLGHARLILCSEGSVDLSTERQEEKLGPRDAVMIDEAEIVEIRPATDSEFYLVEFRII